MKKFLFGVIAPALSMFSLLTMPMQAAAEPCCPPPCCDPCEDDCWITGWMEKLGLILVAAGAGALAGWAASQKAIEAINITTTAASIATTASAQQAQQVLRVLPVQLVLLTLPQKL